MKTKNILYNYYHFGPFLYSTKITQEEIEDIKHICETQKGKDYRKNLAGHLKEEYELPTDSIMKILKPYFTSYVKALYEVRGQTYRELKMGTCWVNYMKKGEYNPPHIHTSGDPYDSICALSCVLYLQVPDNMTEGHVGTGDPPGSIIFTYGESLKNNISSASFVPKVGDFYIFPGWLTHSVCPFKSEGTRISLSANFIESFPNV